LAYLLFILYISVFLLIIYRSRLVVKTGINFLYWAGFFVIKIGVACFYGYWFSKRMEEADTWWFHNESLKETELLRHHPYQFLTNLFQADYVNSGGLFDVFGFWNDLKSNIIIKLLAMLNVFSNGNYYVNTIFYSFITFWGFVFLYRFVEQTIAAKPSIITWLALCFTPSCLFWTSGIHRDGLILLCIGFILYQLSKKFTLLSTKIIGLLNILATFILLFLLRNYVALLLAPIIIAWFFKQFTDLSFHKTVAVLYLVVVLVFFSSSAVQQNIINRKTEFEALQGNSRLPQLNLLPTATSFMKAIPTSLNRVFLQPYIWNSEGIMEVIAAAENIFFFIFIAYCLFKRTTQHDNTNKINFLPLYVFCFSALLLIGLIVPFVGAIVRYKAIFIMLIAFISSTPIKNNLFKYNK